MEDGKGGELSPEVLDNGWLGLGSVPRHSAAKFGLLLSLFLFSAVWEEGYKGAPL